MKKETVKLSGKRKFVTGDSRYCQNCGKESYELFTISLGVKLKNKLQFCKKCYNSNKS